jgi:hypothetical protein
VSPSEIRGAEPVQLRATYPTAAHERAADAVVTFLRARHEVEAVLLVGSCTRARGYQDIDFAALIPADASAGMRHTVQVEWDAFYAADPAMAAVRELGEFGRVDMDFINGAFAPDERGWTSGPSAFELELGNYIAYSVPLFESGGRYALLRDEHLPYYSEPLAEARLADARKYCLNSLAHVHTFTERGICFQAFHRLYDAFREFIQALFIARRTYPIAYDKWIQEQVVEMLGLPELYCQLRAVLEITDIESAQTSANARTLEALLEEYANA